MIIFETLNEEEINHYCPEFLDEYYKFIQDFTKDNIGRMLLIKYPNKSICDYLKLMDIELEKQTSQLLFPEHHLSFYSSIKKYKSKNLKLCHYSGKTIHIGEIYYHYRPLIIDQTTNKKYVVDPSIILKEEYVNILPTNLSQFENFAYNAEYSEDYSEFRTQYGEKISLRQLNKKKLFLK